ncbi:hypothetical protein RHMOL_Rhmol11G0053900 [Rhododendron molle]|uniref:Uncharacterized protein n=1 Tax=Rhododendron molle TaxID=49168 RepID=A0ACC0LPZ0_RHOML|nr:hypothetical protein RHMOL_Rhmol11G0053900 [Rhododendron molle]
MFAEEYQPKCQPEMMAYNWPELALFFPDFSHFNDFVINNLYSNVGRTPYPNPLEPEEEVASNGYDPMDYLIKKAEFEPSVIFSEDANVTMMNLWEDEPGVGTNLWANTEVVNIKVGNEELTVNKAVMEAERWKPEDLWDDLVIADLAANLRDINIESKHKALADLWSEESKYRQIDHLTRSSCIYQPPNLQIGESSNPAAQLAEEPSDPFTTPIKNTFQPFAPSAKEPSRPEKNPEGMIKRQLEQTQAKIRIPILDSENFDYWKSRIKAIMRSADEEIWNSCIDGYVCPMKTVEGKEVSKLTSELSVKEKAKLQGNNRALDILFTAVDVNEHCKIANYEIAKEAWDILVTCHEGTYVVKQSKLQRLTTEFEMIRMDEDETFNQYYSRLISIVNSCETLGKVESSNGKDKKGIKGPPSGPKCYECHGYGHVAHECINKLKKKSNFRANITWDADSESEKSREEREYNSNFIAFGASLHSHDNDHESSDDTDDDEGDEFEDSHELREKYDYLYKESLKINKTNLKLAEKYKNANMELARVQE